MKRQIKNAAINTVLLFMSIAVVGCSDSLTPIQSARETGNAEGISIPERRESTIDIYLDMLPFGEATYFAEELGVAYITSVELVHYSDYSGNDAADFCNTFAIESDYPGDIEQADCGLQEIRASWINVRNTGKKRMKLTARIKGEAHNEMSDSVTNERQPLRAH